MGAKIVQTWASPMAVHEPTRAVGHSMAPTSALLIAIAAILGNLCAGSLVLAQAPQVSTPAQGFGRNQPQNQAPDNVRAYHGGPDRSGNFRVPGLTWERARSLHLDQGFQARIAGNVYAQPLYWRTPGSAAGWLLVATEYNNVYALDAITGAQIWTRSLGEPVPRSALRCGNISPLGITGTPVIDEATQSVYLDANIVGSSGPRHRIFALSLNDGTTMPGWPIDVADALRGGAQPFNSRDQNERGALTIIDGMLYVPFGGHFGDCGDYHGWVVGVSVPRADKVISWFTRARGGGGRNGRRPSLRLTNCSSGSESALHLAAYRITRDHLLRVRLSALAGSAVHRIMAANGSSRSDTSNRCRRRARQVRSTSRPSAVHQATRP